MSQDADRDTLNLDTIRLVAVDAQEPVRSGHPGSPLERPRRIPGCHLEYRLNRSLGRHPDASLI